MVFSKIFQNLLKSVKTVTEDLSAKEAALKKYADDKDSALKTEVNKYSDDKNSELNTALKQYTDNKATETKAGLYSEITQNGKAGEYVTTYYDNATSTNKLSTSNIVTLSNVITTQEELNTQKVAPVGMSNVFARWYRFSHWGGFGVAEEQNLNPGQGHRMGDGRMSGDEHYAARNGWTYDAGSNMIKSNRNSPVYECFINPDKLSNWYLKLLAWGGGDGDNDAICINCCYMKGADGIEHTIDLVRARRDGDNGIYLDPARLIHFRWALVYDYNMTTEKLLATNTSVANAPDNDQGWGYKYCVFSALRIGNTLECYTTDCFNDKNQALTQNSSFSRIYFKMPNTKPADWSDAMFSNMSYMLNKASQMGVGAHSQNGLFTILEQKYIFEDETIYDLVNDAIWKFSDQTQQWNYAGRLSDLNILQDEHLYFNNTTHKLFMYHKGKGIVLAQY